MSRTILVLLVAAASFAGCAPKPLSPAATKISMVRNKDDVKACKSLGKVTSDVSSGAGVGGVGAADNKDQKIQNDLREKTAALGGTHVLVEQSALSGTSSEAEAFACTESGATASPGPSTSASASATP